MIVVDASVVVEVLLGTAAGRAAADRLFARGESLHAPERVDVEVAQVIRRYAANRELKPARAREAIRDLEDLPITRCAHVDLLPRIWELRHHLTAYDAAYLALAEVLMAPLLTRDAGLARVRGRTRIELI
jgi:predicted nucleic acid-binding protein